MLFSAAQLPAPDSFEGIGWMIVAISALVVLVERGMALWSHFKPSPPAGELSLVATQLAKRIEDLEEQRVKDLTVASDRRQKIYAELGKQQDNFQREMNAQRADFQNEIKDVYHRIEKESDKVTVALRQLPRDLIATLRDTGVIKP